MNIYDVNTLHHHKNLLTNIHDFNCNADMESIMISMHCHHQRNLLMNIHDFNCNAVME